MAYPVNVWMVAKRMKHGLMTVRATEHHADRAHGGHDAHGKHEAHAEHDAHGAAHGAMSADPVGAPTRAQLTAGLKTCAARLCRPV